MSEQLKASLRRVLDQVSEQELRAASKHLVFIVKNSARIKRVLEERDMSKRQTPSRGTWQLQQNLLKNQSDKKLDKKEQISSPEKRSLSRKSQNKAPLPDLDRFTKQAQQWKSMDAAAILPQPNPIAKKRRKIQDQPDSEAPANAQQNSSANTQRRRIRTRPSSKF